VLPFYSNSIATVALILSLLSCLAGLASGVVPSACCYTVVQKYSTIAYGSSLVRPAFVFVAVSEGATDEDRP